MRAVRYILLRPLGVAAAIVQWIVLLYAVLGDINPYLNHPGSFYHMTDLQYYMSVLNGPALLLAYGVSSSISNLFQVPDASMELYVIAAIPLVTLQWLLFGSVAEFVIAESRVPSRTVSIINPPDLNDTE